jgi:hypothetical protein
MEDDWLPPGFDEQKLAQVMRAFEAALGADKVFFEGVPTMPTRLASSDTLSCGQAPVCSTRPSKLQSPGQSGVAGVESCPLAITR